MADHAEDGLQREATHLSTSDDCPLHLDNTRVAFIRRPQAEQLKESLDVGSSVQFSGSEYNTATGGDYCLLWLHKFGLRGFVKLPEPPSLDAKASDESTEVDAVTVKVFSSVGPQSIPTFASLAYNPQTQLGDDYGTKITDLDSAHRQVKHPYTPETILEALQQLWLTGGVQNHVSSQQASAKIRPIMMRKNAGKRKRNEAMQLNEALLLSELKNVGFSPGQAKRVLTHDGKGWNMKQPGPESGPDLILTVFRPGQSEPVINDKFEKAHKQLAALWKQEFLMNEPKTPAKVARYTRQQERAEADAAKKNQQQGLNTVQQKQIQDMLAEALQPVKATQQQQRSDVRKLEQKQDALTEITRQQQEMNRRQQMWWERALPAFERMSAQPPCIDWQSAPGAGPSQGPAPLNTQHDSCNGSQAS